MKRCAMLLGALLTYAACDSGGDAEPDGPAPHDGGVPADAGPSGDGATGDAADEADGGDAAPGDDPDAVSPDGADAGGGRDPDGDADAPPPAASACEITFDYDANGDGRADYQFVRRYRPDGELVEERIVYRGEVVRTSRWVRDDADRLVEVVTVDAEGDTVYRERYEYDEAGRVVGSTTDADGDGAADSGWRIEYDDAGQAVRYASDEDGDGAPEAVTTYEYDEAGRLVRFDMDADADGFVDRISRITRECIAGEPCELYRSETAEDRRYRPLRWDDTYEEDRRLERVLDRDADGSVDERTTYLYDDEGVLQRIEFDEDADGRVDSTATVTSRDAEGRPLRLRYRRGGDVVATEAYTYDDAGNPVSRTVTDADGNVLTREAYEYDADGRLQMERSAASADGPWDRVTTWYYDDQGRMLRLETDWRGNQDDPERPEEVYTATEWNEAGEVTRWTIDMDNDGRTDQTWTHTVDDRGNVVTRIAEGSGDEGGDHFEVRETRADGQWVSITWDFYGDATVDWTARRRFDDAGHVVHYENDTDGDGSPETAWEAEYDDAGRLTAYRSTGNRGASAGYTATTACVPVE